MAYAKTSLRKEKRDLRERMRAMGFDYRQIASEFSRVYALRPRAAWREAYGLSLVEAATKFNAYCGDTGLDPRGMSAMTAGHLSEYENWPGPGAQPTGRKPSPYFLAVLSEVYGCQATELVDIADRSSLPRTELMVIDTYTKQGIPPERMLNQAEVIPASAESGQNSIGGDRKRPNLILRHIREEERQETRAEFAEALDVQARAIGEPVRPSERYIARLEDGDIRYPQPAYRRVLMALCDRSMTNLGFSRGYHTEATGNEYGSEQDAARRQHAVSSVVRQGTGYGDESADTQSLADNISELITWIETTNVGDGTIAYLDRATIRLAHDCLTDMPTRSHERAATLAQRVSDLLRGRQRISQTRDLYVIAGKLCAILSWMSSDLGQLSAAEAHGHNGWTLANQADHDGLRALLLSAQSKNAYWARSYGDAALFARRGYEYNPPGTARILLACQEADALQAQGNIAGAQEALARADRARESISRADELGGIFACGTARQANYAIATYLRSGSVGGALRQVERAESAWRGGEEWAFGTWAQVQIGASIAHVITDQPENAVSALQPILNQPLERRLATVTTRLHREVAPLLVNSAIADSRDAAGLREQITDYCHEQPLIPPAPGSETS
jgi:hypothetical protein